MPLSYLLWLAVLLILYSLAVQIIKRFYQSVSALGLKCEADRQCVDSVRMGR